MGFLCLSLVGCVNPDIEHPGEEPPQENPAPEHPSAPAGTSLLLQVVDDSGNPVAGAAVSSQGAVFSVDSSGHLLLEQLPPGRLLARVDALGFTSATAVVELQEGAHAGARVKLLPLPNPIPFQAEQGGTIQTPRVRVTIPPDAVVDALGQPVTGTVNVTIVPLDPTTQLAAMPGPLEATRVADGATVQLESFFMAEVSLWSNGAPVQLASGKSATLEFVLPEALASQFHAGDSVPAWWFDLDEGQWREEGEGRIQPSSTQPDRLAWVAQVKHFTWWNCDAPWTDKSCVNVLVVDGKGTPVEGVMVNAQGTSYSGASGPVSTGAGGRACIEIKRGHTANVFAGLAGEPAAGMATVTGTADAAVCGSGPCTEVQLTLGDFICTPGAYEACAYPGPAGTEGKGSCRAGRRQCNVIGTEWSACQGEVLPAAESCRTPFDDDCDGVVNEDCSCSDQEGSPCYGGAIETQGVGLCHGGTVACDMFGRVVCQGQRLPVPETCSTFEDDNCNGVNEGCEPVSQWFWAVDANGLSCTSSTWMRGMDVDGEGNTLILSAFSGTTTIGGEVFTGDEDDLLLVKVDARGQPVWAKLLDIYSSSFYSTAKESITVDAMGGVVVSGSFVGPLRIDGVSLLSQGSPHVFVARFAPNGRLLWAQQFPAEGDGLGGGAVATDAAGNVLLLARYGYDAIYVAKLDAGTGAPLWSRSIRNLGTLYYAISLDADEAGNVLLVVNVYPSALVMKLEGSTGKELWARSAGLIGGEGGSPPYLKVAGAGSVLVLMNNGSGEAILSKLSADGDELWSHIITDEGVDGLGVDAAGNALVTGTFSGSVDLGGGIRQSRGQGVFVAWYDPQGRYLKDYVLPALSAVDGAVLGNYWRAEPSVDPEGNLLLGGSFADTVDFGMGRVSTCSSSSFVLKMDPTPSTPSHFNPVITRASSSSETATPGQVLTFEVDALDPEGSALGFSWTATTGSPGAPATGASTSRITWTAPSCITAGSTATLTATVTNAFNQKSVRRFLVKGLPSCEWASTGSMAGLRGSHTATLLLDGKVLVAGGEESYSSLATAEVYDPAMGTWSATGSMAVSRSGHTATLLPGGKVLVAGGEGHRTAEVYDPAVGSWRATGSMASSRYHHTATLLPDGKVLVTGGFSGGSTFAMAEVYDPVTGTWSAAGSMVSLRAGHTATLLSDGKVLVSGGRASGGGDLATAEIYDPAVGSWRTTGSMASPRYRHTATLLPDGKVLVSGCGSASCLVLAEVYDPVTATWRATGSMLSPHEGHAATLLPDGRVLISGGNRGDTPVAEVYDPALDTWSDAGSMVWDREDHTATLLPDGKVLVSGGMRAMSAELYTP
ncbi:WD40 repeat domain protein [Cystobacter fuscus DSM 2262]|uniref:WD40 repeat domain protein n=1 Tax=Cystobacter fuscus (strain ATCC 25194 / DSM 2262 / NBRC 100088 / M29) TaxID=1242864 RepID=S9Q9N9_CYSF2|nr:kelch repeat-containing protein [Cystobacter fuscus]EPX58049.1 WD40 repeat domain protein [Cystobacter fuscus DSM 2262]